MNDRKRFEDWVKVDPFFDYAELQKKATYDGEYDLLERNGEGYTYKHVDNAWLGYKFGGRK